MGYFDYRPKIDYIPKDINTVDNIGKSPVHNKKVENYSKNLPSNVVVNLSVNLAKIDDIKSIIDDKLKNTIVHGNIGILDDVASSILKSMEDGQKFLQDGVITYSLYKQCVDNPLMQPIVYEWENYHSGIDGQLEAELLPYINILEKDTKSALEVIMSTVLYDKNTSNIEDIKKQEMEDIENYLNITSKIDEFYRSSSLDIDQINLLRKNRDKIESRLDNNKSIVSMIDEFANETSEILDNVEYAIGDASKKIREESNNDAVKKIRDKFIGTSKDAPKIKLLMYQGFKAQREQLFAKKEEYTSTMSDDIKNNVFKGVITNSRLYTDIASDILNEMDYTIITEEDEYALLGLIAGSYDIRERQFNAMLDMKNILKSTTMNIKNNINDIVDKDRIRLIYKNL
jgi:hypothetical protein